MRTLSLQIIFGAIIALVICVCYILGTILDERFDISPLFTISGCAVGLGIGTLTAYTIMRKFRLEKQEKRKEKQGKAVKRSKKQSLENIPIINVTLDDVRKAVRKYSEQLPKGVYRTVLVDDQNRIDFSKLTHFLGGIPSENFYMSKETYDLFEEKDQLIPVEMDSVQQAVDQYVKEHQKFPILEHDPLRRINYFALCQEHYLKSPPQTTFYLTDLDGMITHTKPNKEVKKRR